MIRVIFPSALFVEFPTAKSLGGVDQIGGTTLIDNAGNTVGRIAPGTEAVFDYGVHPIHVGIINNLGPVAAKFAEPEAVESQTSEIESPESVLVSP